MTSAFVAKCVREVIGEDTVVLNEAITDRPATDRHLTRTKPGTLFASGASSLGWHGGAAVGMKLAHPEKSFVALTGDGTYIFSCPTAVYWMARRYGAPFMTVIFNNQGWNAPKQITKGEHPGGYADSRNTFWTSFNPPAQLDLVAAAAGGAFAKTVTDPSELKAALLEGWKEVKNGTPAVINVMMTPV
jgi:acetolactate synthase I/II/III large subunit